MDWEWCGGTIHNKHNAPEPFGEQMVPMDLEPKVEVGTTERPQELMQTNFAMPTSFAMPTYSSALGDMPDLLRNGFGEKTGNSFGRYGGQMQMQSQQQNQSFANGGFLNSMNNMQSGGGGMSDTSHSLQLHGIQTQHADAEFSSMGGNQAMMGGQMMSNTNPQMMQGQQFQQQSPGGKAGMSIGQSVSGQQMMGGQQIIGGQPQMMGGQQINQIGSHAGNQMGNSMANQMGNTMGNQMGAQMGNHGMAGHFSGSGNHMSNQMSSQPGNQIQFQQQLSATQVNQAPKPAQGQAQAAAAKPQPTKRFAIVDPKTKQALNFGEASGPENSAADKETTSTSASKEEKDAQTQESVGKKETGADAQAERADQTSSEVLNAAPRVAESGGQDLPAGQSQPQGIQGVWNSQGSQPSNTQGVGTPVSNLPVPNDLVDEERSAEGSSCKGLVAL